MWNAGEGEPLWAKTGIAIASNTPSGTPHHINQPHGVGVIKTPVVLAREAAAESLSGRRGAFGDRTGRCRLAVHSESKCNRTRASGCICSIGRSTVQR